jgi:hypothetical protein
MTKQQKITHKRFQRDYSEGSIEVQLNFIVENDVVKVSNIQIHGTFDHGLPDSPTLEQQNNKAFLVSHFINLEGKTLITPIIGNDYADDIVEQILELRKKLT